MKRIPKVPVPTLTLNVHEVAALANVDKRTISRWQALGLRRNASGRFPFPECGLWIQLLRHRTDCECQRDPEIDLLDFLSAAMRLMPERTGTISAGQELLVQLAGFRLSQETIQKIRRD